MTGSITLKCRTFCLECGLSRQVVCHGSGLSRQVLLYHGKKTTHGQDQHGLNSQVVLIFLNHVVFVCNWFVQNKVPVWFLRWTFFQGSFDVGFLLVRNRIDVLQVS